jgi:hypothetical protein
MTFDLLAGVVLAVLALGAVSALTLWSRRIIEILHKGAPSSLRTIRNNITNGRKN